MRERKRLSASVGTCERVHKDSSGGIYVHGSMQFVCVYIPIYRYIGMRSDVCVMGRTKM